MRIALLAGSTYFDATTRSVFDGLRAAYRKAGHRASVLTPPPPGSRKLRFRAKGAAGVRLLRPPSRAGIEAALDAEGADVLHLHFSGRFRPWMRALSPIARKRRTIVSFQDHAHPELPPNGPQARRQLGALLAGCAGVTAVSEFLRRRLEADVPALRGRVRTVRNGVELPRGRGQVRKRRPYILSVGRLAPYKGTDLLLMAFAQAELPGMELVLCGAPFHGTHIRGLIDRLGLGGRVRLTGLIEPAAVRRLTGGCLFYATAPRTETFGMAAAEAMARGKAVLAARTGGIPEYIRHGKNGLLVPPKHVPALARGLRRLAADGSLRRRLGTEAARSARAFSWDAAARRYLALYRAKPRP